VRTIKDRIKAAQDRQKVCQCEEETSHVQCGGPGVPEGSPVKEYVTFQIEREVNSRFIRPFKILQKIRPVAYKVDLPPQLAKVHDVFHVSLLIKVDVDPARILPQVPVEVKEDLTLELRPVRILDREVKEIRNKQILIVRILWQNA
jgi:hypothetical protein